jgi:membrane protein
VETPSATASEPQDPFRYSWYRDPQPHWAKRWSRSIGPTIRYWFETEVHVYAFSVAANSLLAFFPFLIVMVSLCRFGFEWRAGEDAIYLALRDTFPDEMGAFIVRNLRATVDSRGPMQIVSVLILLVTANSLFQPLEVALNRVWGAVKNRSYWKNQLISFGLVFACGGLALVSTVFTAMNQQYWRQVLEGQPGIVDIFGIVAFKVAAIPVSILALFLIYWLLPNCKVPWREILPVAIVVGLLLEAMKYLNLLIWPWLYSKLSLEYGPFRFSVSVILFSAAAAFLILAGAEWAARRQRHADADG